MNRREFIGGFGGLVAVSALPGCRTGKNITFGERGGFERLNLAYTHIEAGATAPFSILHVSDTHFTAAYEHEAVYVCGRAPERTQTFGGRQIESFESTLAWAGKNVDYVLHTGDLINAAVPDPTGDYKRQLEDPTTRAFISYLKGEKLLKGLLVGHEHVAMQDRFSPTAIEYATGGNFMFHAREVLFS